MKLCQIEYQGQRCLARKGASGLELLGGLSGMLEAIERPERLKSAPVLTRLPERDARFLPVVTRPGKVLCVGINYKKHIEETGDIFISAVNADAAYAAKKIIEGIVFEPIPGEIYDGKVTRIIPIGAFVEIAPGKEGLVHISKLENRRVEKVEDVCEVGDEMRVKFLGTDEKGRLNLSRKDAFLN